MVSEGRARAPSIRSVLIRLPIRSSIHIRTRPASQQNLGLQQNLGFLYRCIASAVTPETAWRMAGAG